jgi:hypothetical protein
MHDSADENAAVLRRTAGHARKIRFAPIERLLHAGFAECVEARRSAPMSIKVRE